MADLVGAAAWLAIALLVIHLFATGAGWESVGRRAAVAILPLMLFIVMFGAPIREAVALLAAFGAGYGYRGEREQARRRKLEDGQHG